MAKKQDLIDTLTKQGVALTGKETVPQLEALAKALPAEPGATAAVATPTALAKADKDSVTIKYRDHVGQTVERTFSKDVHGDNFADVADEFSKTNADKLVK